jgi:hypothetical protein
VVCDSSERLDDSFAAGPEVHENRLEVHGRS